MEIPFFIYPGRATEYVAALDQLPFWKMLLIIMSGIILMSVTFLLITHFTRRNKVEVSNLDGASLSNEINAGVYGLILGFLIVTMYDTNRKVEESACKEANVLTAILESSSDLDNAVEIKEAIKNYIHELLDEQWPLLRHNDLAAAWKLSPKMMASLTHVVKKTKDKDSRHALLDLVQQLHNDHRWRLMQADIHLPVEFWRTILLLSALTIWFLVYMNPWTGWHAMIPIMIPSIIVALCLTLLVSLQYPFSGPFQVSNEVYSLGALNFENDKK
jgi:hypothetical protein